MPQRRQFIRDLSTGALSTLALAAVGRAQSTLAPPDTGTAKKVRVGIIGAENSHTVNFGRLFNGDKKFPGVEVVALWGETDEFAKNAAEKGLIPKIVKRQEELLGQIDALIIDHRHPRYHIEAAVPFVEAGIPTFVDKPFCYRVRDGRMLIEIAEKHGTPITCLSGVAYSPVVDDLAEQAAALTDVQSVVITGPSDIKSKYGGIFFYGIHTVERLFRVFGDKVEAVRATRNGDNVTFQFQYANGLIATYVPVSEWDIWVARPDGMKKLEPRVNMQDDSLYMYAAIVKMFQTGVEPRTHESLLPAIAALEAMERSVGSGEWEYLLV